MSVRRIGFERHIRSWPCCYIACVGQVVYVCERRVCRGPVIRHISRCIRIVSEWILIGMQIYTEEGEPTTTLS